jgi:CubicO group peptidase (beta-lactamase class C family)
MVKTAIQTVSDAMVEAVSKGLFPGAVLLVHHRKQVLHEAYGYSSLVPQQTGMTQDTLFDLASLTKAVATTTAIMCLIADQQIALNDPVSRFIPDFLSQDRKEITLFHLLTHSSGLPDWRPFYQEVSRLTQEQSGIRNIVGSKSLLYELIHQEPLVYPTGSKSFYSDLGFILLGEIIEKVTQKSLDKFCEERIFTPLKMRDTFFLPLYTDHQIRVVKTRNIASTENCPWRGRVLRGEVQDENAHVMGGVAGHAGLFSTAQDLYTFLKALLKSLYSQDGFLPQSMVKAFVTRQARIPDTCWGLGWTIPSEPSTSGQFFSTRSFGHLGFTGTSLWVDPDVDLMVILLTNRVHPSRENDQIRLFRPFIHDLIYQATVKKP